MTPLRGVTHLAALRAAGPSGARAHVLALAAAPGAERLPTRDTAERCHEIEVVWGGRGLLARCGRVFGFVSGLMFGLVTPLRGVTHLAALRAAGQGGARPHVLALAAAPGAEHLTTRGTAERCHESWAAEGGRGARGACAAWAVVGTAGFQGATGERGGNG